MNKEYFVKYRENNRQRLLDNNKRWADKNKPKLKLYYAEYYKKNKEDIREKSKLWHKNNVEYMKKFNQQPIRKAILKANRQAKEKIKMIECKECGSTENLNHHHPNYNNPLDVIILCENCHYEWHRQNKPIYPILING